MKKINNKIAILLLALVPFLWSCGDEEPIFYSDGDFVSFQAQSSNVGENAGSGTLTIARSTTDLSGSLTVDVTVTSEYASTTSFFDAGDDASATFTINTTQLTFAAGEATQTINITGIDDALSSGDKTVTVTISGVSDNSFNIGTPGPDALFSTHVVTLVDDDCPIDIPGDWVGTYTLTEGFTAGTNAGFSFGFTNVTNLSVDATNTSGTGALLNNDATSPAGNDFWSTDTSLEFDTCPESLILDGTINLAFTVSGSTATYTLSSSSYSTDAGTITLVGDLGNTAGSNFGEYTITLTQN